MTGAPRHAAVYVKLVLVAVFWGGAFIGGRIAATEMAPAAAAFWRFVVATVALLAVTFAVEGGLPRLRPRQWLSVALLGATGVALFNLCFMYGLARVPAARGALIMALNPAVTVLGAALFLGERLTQTRALGIAVALAGVSVVLGHGNPLNLVRGDVGLGDVVLLGCPLSFAAYTLLGKPLMRAFSPLAVTTCAALVGTALLALVLAWTGSLVPPAASLRAWAAVGFTGLFGTAVSFVWFYEGVRALGPARTSVFINLVPVAAIALSVVVLGEPLEASMLAGGALVVAGVWILNRPQRVALAPQPTAG